MAIVPATDTGTSLASDAKTTATTGPKKRRLFLRPVFLVIVLAFAVFFGWLLWPVGPQISPYDLSRQDGKSRFFATKLQEFSPGPNLNFTQRLYWKWVMFTRTHGKRNPAAYTFSASQFRPCSISGLLTQCMQVTGTRYLIAVEISGPVFFGTTNALSGAQWVAAFEQAIQDSGPVICYDYATKTNFEDELLLIRERRDLVKIVPRTKLKDYQKAGLVKERDVKTVGQ